MTLGSQVYDTLKEHGEIIHDNILPKLKEHDKIQMEFKQELATIRASQTSLELTVMKDGQQTRDLLGRFVDHYFGTDDKKLVMREKVTLKRLSTTEKVILGIVTALGGTGGILAGIAAVIQMMK